MFHLRFGLSDHLKALLDFVFGSRRRVKKVRIFRAWFSQIVQDGKTSILIRAEGHLALQPVNRSSNVCGCMHKLREHPRRSEEIPHLWLARLAGSCQSRLGHSAHCPVQGNVQQSHHSGVGTKTLWHCSGESVPTFGDQRLQQQLVMRSPAEKTSLDASPSQQLFSAALLSSFLSSLSQQLFSAAFLRSSSQQLFSADFLSSSSQQLFLSYHL